MHAIQLLNNRRRPVSLFDDMFGLVKDLDVSSNAISSSTFNASIDFIETKDHFFLTLDIPGVKKEDIEIEVTGDQIKVSASRELDSKEDDILYHRRERL